MKINFDWHDFMSKENKLKNLHTADAAVEERKNVKNRNSAYYHFGEDPLADLYAQSTERFFESVNSQDYLAVQRDFMTVMSNSMSSSDFQKMKEEGYDISSMDPEQAVTILDKIKTVLAQSGTRICGYNDDLSAEVIQEITGSSGYAQTIARELAYADAPVTEENISRIDQVVDQALTQREPDENSMIYLIRQGKRPTLSNLYRAEHSSVGGRSTGRRMGYASNSYSRQGVDAPQVRKTAVSEEDYRQMEQQIRSRIAEDGLEVNEDTMECGRWLLEKGLPVTGENIGLLQEMKEISFPLDISKIIRMAANAISEGSSPFEICPSGKDESIYQEAVRLCERFEKLTYQAADHAVNNYGVCTLKNMETFDPMSEYTMPQLQARKTLEEVRLKMTAEANVKLLQSGFQIETASMEELIKQLDAAQKSLNESLFGTRESGKKAELFSQTNAYLKELPQLPVSVIGKIPFMERATVSGIVKEGQLLRQQYEQVQESYEAVMTAPRADLGDNIRKAFRNTDAILQDMNLEINESNRRAIRIMGYNQITITQDNLDRVKKADRQVRNVIERLKPAMTLEMIREGKNPLEMSMDELQDYICEKENDFINDTQKYSEFLYKLDKKKDITEAERDAYIGIYRLIRQIEKSDGAVIGRLVNQDAEISFSNLLSSVRTGKAKHTDVRVDDSTGITADIKRKGDSISEQIERGIAAAQKAAAEAGTGKAPEEIWEDVRSIDFKQEQQLKEQQLKEIREISAGVTGEKEYLEQYHLPATIDYMQSVMVLREHRGETFRKVYETEREMELSEEGILEKAEGFLASMDEEETRGISYENMISRTKQILESALEYRRPDYMNIKELQSVYKQISVASSLAREENYEIPLQIGEEITSVNLKVVHKTEHKGEVKITMETERFGKVEARFTQTPDGLEGSILTDYMDGKKILESGAEKLTDAIKDALKETETEMKNLFFGTNEKLDLNVLDKGEKDVRANVSLLYKVAKEFIRYVKEA